MITMTTIVPIPMYIGNSLNRTSATPLLPLQSDPNFPLPRLLLGQVLAAGGGQPSAKRGVNTTEPGRRRRPQWEAERATGPREGWCRTGNGATRCGGSDG